MHASIRSGMNPTLTYCPGCQDCALLCLSTMPILSASDMPHMPISIYPDSGAICAISRVAAAPCTRLAYTLCRTAAYPAGGSRELARIHWLNSPYILWSRIPRRACYYVDSRARAPCPCSLSYSLHPTAWVSPILRARRVHGNLRSMPRHASRAAAARILEAEYAPEPVDVAHEIALARDLVKQRRDIVWQCRVRGLSNRETHKAIVDAGLPAVADACLYQDARIVVKAINNHTEGWAIEARALELSRLDALWRAWISYGLGDREMLIEPSKEAAVILLRIIDVRRQLLGLDIAAGADAAAQDRPLATVSDADLQGRIARAQLQLAAHVGTEASNTGSLSAD